MSMSSQEAPNVSTISSTVPTPVASSHAQTYRSSDLDSYLATGIAGGQARANSCATRFLPFLISFFIINLLIFLLFNDKSDRPFLNLLLGFTFLAIFVVTIFTFVEIRNFYRQNGILFSSDHDDRVHLVERGRRLAHWNTFGELLNARSHGHEEAIDSSGRTVRSGRSVVVNDNPPEYEAPPSYEQLDVDKLVVVIPIDDAPNMNTATTETSRIEP